MPDNPITTGINMSYSGYSLDQILQTTKPPSSGGGFRRVLGGLLGGVGNMFAPGIGGMIGSMISGGLGGAGGLGGTGGLLQDTMQYLQLQRQMNAETEAFQTASTIMKCRHDAAMAAVHNMQ
ncbi:MAG TPA: hypothetical protein VMT05_00720 [Terriglobales bacterium]|nr:hypothetical protein [Terriglobales bacterium]